MAKIILRSSYESPNNTNDTYGRVYYYDTSTNTIGYVRDAYVFLRKDVLYTQFPEMNLSQNDTMFKKITGYYFADTDKFRADGYALHEYCVNNTTTHRAVETVDLENDYYPTTANIVNTDTTNVVTCGFIPNDIKILKITQTPSGSDMSVAITATSSNGGLMYSINGVDYQVSNVFTISVAGTYIAYARDAEGFIASEAFVVYFNTVTYGLRYYSDYSNDLGEYVEVKISEKDYVGSEEIVKLGGTPIKIKYNQEGDDKYKPIKGSECVVNLISETDFQFVDLFSAEDKKYKLDVVKTITRNNEFTTSLTDWSQSGSTAPWSWIAGKASVTKGAHATSKYLYQPIYLKNAVDYSISMDITNTGGDWALSILAFDSVPGDGVTIKAFGASQSDTSFTYTSDFTLTTSYNNFCVYFSLGGSSGQILTVDNLRVSHTIWSGFIAPEAYSEPYVSTPYTVTASFLDGLGVLKRKDFLSPTNENINTLKTQFEVLRICLAETGLTLPVWTSISIFEAGMPGQSSTDDPLTQCYINTEVYYTKGGKPKNCYEVLESILEIYGARIFQEDGAWKIVNIDELGAAYYARVYSSGGVYSSTYTLDQSLTLASPSTTNAVHFTGGGQKMDMKPAYKAVEAEIPINEIETIVKNGNFTQDAVDETVFKEWNDEFGILSKTASKDEDGKTKSIARIAGDGGDNSWSQFIEATPIYIPSISSGLKLSIKIRYVCMGDRTIDSVKPKFKLKVNAKWADINGDWQNTETFITPESSINGWEVLEIVCDPIPSSGYMEFQVYQAQCFDIGKDVNFLDIDYINISFIQGNSVLPDTKTKKVENEGLYVFKPEVKKLTFGDFPEYPSSGLLLRNAMFTDSVGETTTASWLRLGQTESRDIVDLLLDRILNNHISPTQIINGSLYGRLRFNNIISDPNNEGKKFMINAMEIDERSCTYRVELVEISTTVDTTAYILTEDSEKLTTENGFYLLRES